MQVRGSRAGSGDDDTEARRLLSAVPIFTRAAKKSDPAEQVVEGRTLSANGEKLIGNLQQAKTRPL